MNRTGSDIRTSQIDFAKGTNGNVEIDFDESDADMPPSQIETMVNTQIEVEPDENVEYSMYYSIFCLMVVTCAQISNTWSRTAISSMFGYGVVGEDKNPFYAISHDIDTLNSDTYGSLVGFWYSLPYAPMLLFVGHLTETWNRKYMIGIACFSWGLASYLNAYATNLSTLYLLRSCVGFAQAFSGPPTYSLVTDFFPVRHRVKAFFAFSIL